MEDVWEPLKLVIAMDEIVYEALSRYYHALELKGYMPITHSLKLLVLSFYRDAVLKDFMQMITEEDLYLIEKAFNCLYGTSCVLPYPDYKKGAELIAWQIPGKYITPPKD